jgi:hypothetical protein
VINDITTILANSWDMFAKFKALHLTKCFEWRFRDNIDWKLSVVIQKRIQSRNCLIVWCITELYWNQQKPFKTNIDS